MRYNESGVTLIELMIVVVISALLTAAIYAAFISQQKSYAIQTGVTDMQQNARAALSLMERDLRMAGYLVDDAGFTVQDFDNNNITQAITVDETGSTDKITVVYAAQQVAKVAAVNGTQVTVSDVTAFDTANGKQYIAFESENKVYTISNIAGNVLTLTSPPPGHLANMRSSEATPGAWAYLVKAITYQVDRSNDPSTGQPRNTFERVTSDQFGTVPDTEDLWDDIANYITDLQIAYPYDPGTGPDNNLLHVTLTSTYTDHEGTPRTRQHEAVLNIRNIGL
jgi:prepilin-type N-terminal cleavage/methylation domain-containing protein